MSERIILTMLENFRFGDNHFTNINSNAKLINLV
ncbi:MAG: hypothetical protein JWR44_1066 [Hymenobacter sp.]|jgi:hypothetical protein|nr:hypothetical protein [Hymenobacter sp.]